MRFNLFQGLDPYLYTPTRMGKIKPLDPQVVQKIAAGEIIVSPANALKELIENSIDAGATNIEVVVKNGGHKLLQVTDNGHGIDDEDLEILCQRFTTSKISNFQDLQSVNTLGFRGEALASISHIAHLSVRTKTKNSRTASLVTYQDGKLTSHKRAAGVQGTQISVEDLFYNAPLRSHALQGGSDSSSSGEYQKILDVVSKYSIQYPGVFSCKRHHDSQPVVISGKTQLEKLKKVYGSSTSQSLMELKVDTDESIGLKSVAGWVSTLNYTTKRSIPFIFFINKRMVSCDPLSRAIRKTYQEYLPKGGNAFVFLSLEIQHENIDVNVHPTKREVFFLHETEIIEVICENLRKTLEVTEGKRDYRVQSYIATSVSDPQSSTSTLIQPSATGIASAGNTYSPVAPLQKPRYEYNLVRTDPHQAKLTSFMLQDRQSPVKKVRISHQTEQGEGNEEEDEDEDEDEDNDNDITTPLKSKLPPPPSSPVKAMAEKKPQKEYKHLHLSSVNELLGEIKERSHMNLLYLFAEHTYIGLVDRHRSLAAIQVGVKLYLVEYTNVFKALFYQISLMQIGNFGTVHLGDGLSIPELLAIAPKVEGVAVDFHQLIDMKMMLEDYFQIVLRQKHDQWCLVQLPVIMPEYTLIISKIPQFIADLVTKVNWEDEKECIHDIACALSELHAPTSTTKPDSIRLLFDASKTSFVPSRELLPCVVEIANLPGLYKVFERC